MVGPLAGTDMNSCHGIQTGAAKALLDAGGLCYRVQHHGVAAVDCLYTVVLHPCGAGGHGLGMHSCLKVLYRWI